MSHQTPSQIATLLIYTPQRVQPTRSNVLLAELELVRLRRKAVRLEAAIDQLKARTFDDEERNDRGKKSSS